MTIEFLGTGTSQGIPVVTCRCAVCRSSDHRDKRLRTSALVRAEGRTILIDAGPDLREQMLCSEVDRLDGVLLTHEHMDHIGGIDELRAFNFHQGRAMDLHADPRTQLAIRRMYHYAFGKERYPGVPELELCDIPDGTFHIAGIPILPIEVMHYMLPVLGFRVGDLTYITDAKTIAPEEKEKAMNSDVLVLNALRKEPHISHLNLDEALGLIAELRPARAYLTHISHLLGAHAEISAELPRNVHLAYDGLVVELADP